MSKSATPEVIIAQLHILEVRLSRVVTMGQLSLGRPSPRERMATNVISSID